MSIDFQSGTRELRNLQVALEPLSSPAALAGVTSVAQTLDQLISGFQDRAVSGTGAADIGLPVIGAEADPDRDTFLGAFNVTSLVDVLEMEFDGVGGDLVAAFIQNPNQIGDAVEAAFKDALAVAGGNLGDQILSGLGERLFSAGAPLAGLGTTAGLGLGALALGGGHILEAIFGALTPDETAAREARGEVTAEREAQGIFGRGFIPDIKTNSLDVLGFGTLTAQEIADRIALGDVGLDAEGIEQAIQDGWENATDEEIAAFTSAIVQAFGPLADATVSSDEMQAAVLSEIFSLISTEDIVDAAISSQAAATAQEAAAAALFDAQGALAALETALTNELTAIGTIANSRCYGFKQSGVRSRPTACRILDRRWGNRGANK